MPLVNEEIVDYVYKQLDILKTAYDEGFMPSNDKLKDLTVANSMDNSHGLKDTNILLLEELWDEVVIKHTKFVDQDTGYGRWLLEKDIHEDNVLVIFRSKIWSEYDTLLFKIRECVSKAEYGKLYHGGIMNTGVIMDYLNAIIRDSYAYYYEVFWGGQKSLSELVMVLDSEYQLEVTEIVWWSHLMIKLIKKSIPKMKEYLKSLKPQVSTKQLA